MLSRRRAAQATMVAVLGTTGRAAAANTAADVKVVYHLPDVDRVHFALNCINNHFAGVDPEAAIIVLVVHGPALAAFRRDRAGIDVTDRLASLIELGLRPQACINTLRAEGIAVDALLPGFTVAEHGGVVRLAELQNAGYAYIRP